MDNYEKLGAFYLGKIYDREKGIQKDDLLLYDSKDLTTHAVCMGMTGSGKTGLCVSLLEEAAIDGIPALVIDPKGDMGNLMLTFPELNASDFRPWIEESEAMRKGMTPDKYADEEAKKWLTGLADWGQDKSRIAKYRQSVDINIFTPGSNAGMPISLMTSFEAPPPTLLHDPDTIRDRILSAVSGILTLAGITADPIRSREHILLSNIFQEAWTNGTGLSLERIIQAIQNPPFKKIGVFSLESFFPSSERMDLAMRLNNLLASPGFSAWMYGEPLNIQRMLYTLEGKPRISIFSIAHLSDTERMFFVTTLLNEVVTWMRTQSGTSSLRALLYMDEIFGYFPPTASPPSKTPMLTLLKQARAFGLGIVLSTQNPVDLDYKGLANAGTWFIGRLQTERDKERVLDGLEGVSTTSGGSFDRSEIDRILSGLQKRVFYMHNVHENHPTLFYSRWALSYLRGPLTREQINSLMADRLQTSDILPPEPETQKISAPIAPKEKKDEIKTEILLPAKIKQSYAPLKEAVSEEERLVYRPSLLGTGRLHFVSTKAQIDRWETYSLLSDLPDEDTIIPWKEGNLFINKKPFLLEQALPNAAFSEMNPAAGQESSYKSWAKSLSDYFYQNQTLKVWNCPELNLYSNPGENEGDFRARILHLAHENRDLEVEKLRAKYTPKIASLQERLRKAQLRVEKESSQYGQEKVQTAISFGATVLGALFGRKTVSTGTIGRATTGMRGLGRAARQKEDVALAKKEVEVIQQKLNDLEEEAAAEIQRLQEKLRPEDLHLEEEVIRPRKSDISIGLFSLVWIPWKVGPDGLAEPAGDVKAL